VLRRVDSTLPRIVADLIDKDNHDHPSWMKYLLSSQLDMDRLDYLRRDSLFTGAGYGHFDYYRILNTFELFGSDEAGRDIVWGDKSKLAIEEYIFSRYYMYQNVYLHKTTRCFEKMIEAMWKRAKMLHDEGKDVNLVAAIRDFWASKEPTVQQYLRMEEHTVLEQIQAWTSHSDKALSDLARRFLGRERLAMIDPPAAKDDLAPNHDAWERALLDLVKTKADYVPAEMYCLRDQVQAKYNQPYFPEKEADEQSAKNAIRLKINGEREPVEISTLLDRLKALTQEPVDRVRYYIPKELQDQARKMRAEWKVSS
jgi:HD superfamily phosphohydrolase